MIVTDDQKDTDCGGLNKMSVTYTKQTEKEMERETKAAIRLCLTLRRGQGSVG